MQLHDNILIDVPREKIWSALNDPNVLVDCIPGCEEVRQQSPTETHIRVLIKLGPVRARFVGKILMSDVHPNEACVLNFEGSGGAAGFAKGSSTIRLLSEAGGTRLTYTAQASVGGKLGQIGGRMIDASAKQTADQFFAAFSKRLTAGNDALADSATLPHSTPSTSTIAVANRAPNMSNATAEGTRVLWFALGALSTAFGFWVAFALSR
jgi:uncharacterized protein